MHVFSIRDRDRVRDRVLQLADSDARVVGGAVVGSMALGAGDRWSDLDLAFAVADDEDVADVLADWSGTLVEVAEVQELAASVEPQLLTLMVGWDV